MSSPTLLIDADVVAYIASLKPTAEEVIENIERAVQFYRDRCDSSDILMCLSDAENFRKILVSDTYKANRGPKPENYGVAMAHIEANYRIARFPMLEADDVMGVLATSAPGDCIIVSIDKDMKQIPGRLFNPNKWQDGIVEISQHDADLFFHTQVITGDSTDGYPGIPGAGPKKAEKLLGLSGEHAPVELWRLVETAFIEYFAPKHIPPENACEFAKAFALTQARLARILRAEDYDWVTEELKLWTPFSEVSLKG